ncbi:MAG: alpha-ketoglutarate-dependent dioxygenase AlkB [Ilumatobacter sp.]|nr:alpha-ketoglutarate-dependent dioxygenase AlkB [Ilumatobacter sp.]
MHRARLRLRYGKPSDSCRSSRVAGVATSALQSSGPCADRPGRGKIEHVFLQGSLFGVCDPAVDERFAEARRVDLDDRSWVEFVPGWLVGADAVFDELLDRLELRQRTNIPMYDSLVDEPRLTASWRAPADGGPGDGPTTLLGDILRLLIDRYHRPFDSIGFNLYRDGNDSVAWHGDRHRHHVTDPVVAILSVGQARALRLRPRGGGPSHSWNLGGGDLFVMGGACQHEWEHSVPKLRRAVGPRLSITYRHDTAST